MEGLDVIDDGCDEGGPSRRGVLRAVGATGLAFAAGPILAPTAEATATAGARDVLVLVSLRGGFDGLSAVVPGADSDYRAKRPTLGIPTASLLPLDATFGLHPVMAPILPFWRAGSLAVVQDVGQVSPTRSHFEALREMERAAPGSGLRTGWMDRLLGSLPRTTVFQGMQVGTAKSTDAFKGSFPELALRTIDGFTLAGTDADTLPKRQAVYRALYAKAPEVIRTPAFVAMDAVTATSKLKAAGYTPANGAVYPSSDLGRALRDVARLVTSGAGVQLACVDVNDWDMHAAMGTVGEGKMARKLGDLATALTAFATDLGPRMDGVTVVTLSGFGRRVAENGSGGTDHGHGGISFVVGGGVVGGKVYGRWPGLATSALVQGDLPGSTDYRRILAEIATKRLGVGSVTAVFPGFTPEPLGVFREKA